MWCLLIHMWTTPVCGQNLYHILSSKKWEFFICSGTGRGKEGSSSPNFIVEGQSSSTLVQLVTHANSNQWCRLKNSQVSTCGFQSALLSSKQFIASRSSNGWQCAKNSKLKGLQIINFAFSSSRAPPLYSTFCRLCLWHPWPLCVIPLDSDFNTPSLPYIQWLQWQTYKHKMT